MKILAVCQNYYPENFRITDICETLVKRGHDVTILTGLPNYPEGYIYEEYRAGKNRHQNINGVEIIRCSEIARKNNIFSRLLNYYSFSLSASFKAKKLSDDFDVILSYQISPVMMVRPAIAYKKKFKKKLLVYSLDLWPASLGAGGIDEDSIIYKIFYHFSRNIYKQADILATAFNSAIDYFNNELKLNNINITYIPQYAEDVFMEISSSGNNENNEINLLFAGNIGKAQSVETIIKAANELKNYTQIKWHIIGDGSSYKKCVELANKLMLKNVLYYGRKPFEEMKYYYSNCDAMLLTLIDDKNINRVLPSKAQSYMAAGKPIIAAANGETADVIEKSKCGFCVPAEDYHALADSVLKFLNSTNKGAYGKAGREYYLKYFSKEISMQELEETLESLINYEAAL